MKKIILTVSLFVSTFGFSQENILSDPIYQSYQNESIALMTSKDYLNFEKLKNEWFKQENKETVIFLTDDLNKLYADLNEAYILIKDKDSQIAKMRIDLIEKYSQDTLLKNENIIKEKVFQINSTQ